MIWSSQEPLYCSYKLCFPWYCIGGTQNRWMSPGPSYCIYKTLCEEECAQHPALPWATISPACHMPLASTPSAHVSVNPCCNNALFRFRLLRRENSPAHAIVDLIRQTQHTASEREIGSREWTLSRLGKTYHQCCAEITLRFYLRSKSGPVSGILRRRQHMARPTYGEPSHNLPRTVPGYLVSAARMVSGCSVLSLPFSLVGLSHIQLSLCPACLKSRATWCCQYILFP